MMPAAKLGLETRMTNIKILKLISTLNLKQQTVKYTVGTKTYILSFHTHFVHSSKYINSRKQIVANSICTRAPCS